MTSPSQYDQSGSSIPLFGSRGTVASDPQSLLVVLELLLELAVLADPLGRQPVAGGPERGREPRVPVEDLGRRDAVLEQLPHQLDVTRRGDTEPGLVAVRRAEGVLGGVRRRRYQPVLLGVGVVEEDVEERAGVSLVMYLFVGLRSGSPPRAVPVDDPRYRVSSRAVRAD